VLTPSAVDLFSGAGGTTQGLRDAGYAVLAAVENDSSAAKTFAANHRDTLLYERDIRYVQAPALARKLGLSNERRLDLLTACPPCQPFSTLGSGNAEDPRNALVSSIRRFVEQLRPRAVVLENVPGLLTEPRFMRLIADLEYDFDLAEYMVQATDFGVPQNRRRMIVIAIEKSAYATLPEDLVSALPAEFDRTARAAGDALRLARKIDPATDSAHRARSSQPMTIRRMRAVKQGGGRLQLPKELELACHTKLEGRSATSIYGRIDPAKPAPTMTTRCTTPSCGRFVHPEENRGLTLREAALLQTFPASYEFEGSYGAIERQIGNAVPVRLAHALGLVVEGLLDGAEEAEHDGVQEARSAVATQAA
jgi:DNA (cytosine-5)-methyltransferase 1